MIGVYFGNLGTKFVSFKILARYRKSRISQQDLANLGEISEKILHGKLFESKRIRQFCPVLIVCKLRAAGIEAKVRPSLLLTAMYTPRYFKVNELVIFFPP